MYTDRRGSVTSCRHYEHDQQKAVYRQERLPAAQACKQKLAHIFSPTNLQSFASILQITFSLAKM
jgi:hypothetical protein